MRKSWIIAAVILTGVGGIVAGHLWQSTAQPDHTEISLWEEEQPAIQDILDLVIEKFQARHPGIRVKRSHFKTEDLRSQFQVGAIGGQGPELILAPNDFAGVFKEAGIIQPVQQ